MLFPPLELNFSESLLNSHNKFIAHEIAQITYLQIFVGVNSLFSL